MPFMLHKTKIQIKILYKFCDDFVPHFWFGIAPDFVDKEKNNERTRAHQMGNKITVINVSAIDFLWSTPFSCVRLNVHAGHTDFHDNRIFRFHFCWWSGSRWKFSFSLFFFLFSFYLRNFRWHFIFLLFAHYTEQQSVYSSESEMSINYRIHFNFHSNKYIHSCLSIRVRVSPFDIYFWNSILYFSCT